MEIEHAAKTETTGPTGRARTGKIAKLPRAAREELNARLADGEATEAILKWLNEQPATRAHLDAHQGEAPSRRSIFHAGARADSRGGWRISRPRRPFSSCRRPDGNLSHRWFACAVGSYTRRRRGWTGTNLRPKRRRRRIWSAISSGRSGSGRFWASGVRIGIISRSGGRGRRK